MIYLMEIGMIFYLIIVLCSKFTSKFYKLSSVVEQLNITSHDQENLAKKLLLFQFLFFSSLILDFNFYFPI